MNGSAVSYAGAGTLSIHASTLRGILRHRRWLVIAVQAGLVIVGYTAAFALRFDGRIPASYVDLLLLSLPLVLALRLSCLAWFGLYHGLWQHVGMQDLLDLLKAITLSSVLLAVSLWFTGLLYGFPRSVFVIDWLLAVMMLGGMRFLVRGVREGRVAFRSNGGNGGKRVLIVGAGETAERLLRQLQHEGSAGMNVLGLVDDDPAKRDLRLHGVPVLGTSEDVAVLVARHRVQMIIIAIPSATRARMQHIIECCRRTKAEFRIVPSLLELLDGEVRLNQLRPVQITDLLGRDPVELDLEPLRQNFHDRVVLITGGAGSIGSELARQIAPLRPSRLVLLDNAESRLYFTHLDLVRQHPELEIVPVICDITDPARLQQLFAKWRPAYVFHAAAYKHVPMMETNAIEAVKNNVLGTLCTVQCAIRNNVGKFVLISTDKAVRPSSVMGATKRIAERIVLSWPQLLRSGTDFRAVRFGNVLDSDGSVVPLFRRQLAAGGPLTVTDPEVSRYFMTIPEAVHLVLQAAVLPEARRRISMLEMGEPVRILDLAENLIRLSGLEPYRDVPIVFTGLRPAEKLHEELMSQLEATVPTSIDGVRIVQSDEPDPVALEQGLNRLAGAVEAGDGNPLLVELCRLVPECVAPLAEAATTAQRLSWKWQRKLPINVAAEPVAAFSDQRSVEAFSSSQNGHPQERRTAP